MRKIAIVGTVSNAEKYVESDLRRLVRACSDFEIAQIFLVESDSDDRTVEILEKLSTENKNFKFKTFGKLRIHIPERIARIRYCRNYYVKELKESIPRLDIDYVIVADLDGMNSKISRSGIRSTFARDDWSVALANQLGGYYDLLALRHYSWCPSDILSELKSEQVKIDKSFLPMFSFIKRIKRRCEFDKARKKAIYSRMRRINPWAPWIDVLSGFGGLGVYRSDIFIQFDYSLMDADAQIESEHVALSNRIINSGGKILINPRMINNYFNTYNINRFFIIRQFREIYWNTLRKIRG